MARHAICRCRRIPAAREIHFPDGHAFLAGPSRRRLRVGHTKSAAGGRGKTEMWHFVSAEQGAQLLFGLKPGVDKAAFLARLEESDARIPFPGSPRPRRRHVFRSRRHAPRDRPGHDRLRSAGIFRPDLSRLRLRPCRCARKAARTAHRKGSGCHEFRRDPRRQNEAVCRCRPRSTKQSTDRCSPHVRFSRRSCGTSDVALHDSSDSVAFRSHRFAFRDAASCARKISDSRSSKASAGFCRQPGRLPLCIRSNRRK